ncbi:hypothetical protein AAHC03_019219 [Spirometra sp. Aus1]
MADVSATTTAQPSSAISQSGTEPPQPAAPTGTTGSAQPPPTLLITRSKSIVNTKESSTAPVSDDSFIDDLRAVRRIVAEDSKYNLENVKSLVELVLEHIICNFAFNYSALPYLDREQRRYVLDTISVDTPLKVTAFLIPEDPFWKRCCLSRWPVVDVIKHGNSWKRAFFEKRLEEMIQQYIPGETYPVWIEEALEFAAPFVKRLDIKEMLPPVRKRPKKKSHKEDEEDDSDNDSESVDLKPSIQADHLDLGFVIAKLKFMEHLGVQYRVRNCGLNFEWSQFQFTGKDCLSFSKAIKAHQSLVVLELVKSRVDCERCRVLVGHLLDHPTLKSLNLAHNIISDWGARALGKLISGRSELQSLNLTNNRLTADGGEALGHALTKNAKKLIKLNLRLNRLMDEGGSAIAKALIKNNTLRELDLASNGLGDMAILIFGQVLTHNATLSKLDLSNNKIGADAGRKLQECIASNMALTYLDLRFTGCPQVSEFAMQQTVESNDNRIRLETEVNDCGSVKLPGIISVAVDEVMPTFEKAKVRQSFFARDK